MRRRDYLPSITLWVPPRGAPFRKCAASHLSLGCKILPALTAGLLLLGGCYTYAETSVSSLSPGIQARVRLDEDGFGRLVNQAAENGVPVDMLDVTGRGVVGRVMTLGASNMTVQLRGAGGAVFAADVPMGAVQNVAVRTFSRRRTVVATAVGAILFAAIYTGTTGGTTSDPPTPEPEQLVLPFSALVDRILDTPPLAGFVRAVR